MKTWTPLVAWMLLCPGLSAETASEAVLSPNGEVKLTAALSKDMFWSVSRKGRTVLLPSRLGIKFSGQEALGACRVVSVHRQAYDETWENPRYKKRYVQNRANELTLELEELELPRRRLTIVFRAYDDGVAYRYEIPAQAGLDSFGIDNELGDFRFEGDPEGWFTLYPSEYDGHERPYLKRSIRAIPLKTPFDSGRAPERTRIGLPAVIELDGQVAAIAEADLNDWAGLFLEPVKSWGVAPGTSRLAICLASREDGRGAVIGRTPHKSPWRVVALGDRAEDLVSMTDLIQNLNPPAEGDFSWVKAGACGWDWWALPAQQVSETMMTRSSKCAQIDFAAEMGWPFYLIDAFWCVGSVKNDANQIVYNATTDLTKYDPELDIPGVVEHARRKGVGVLLWVYWTNLESNGVERVFSQFEKWGVAGVKVDFMERQDQEMVRWYSKVVECAARHRLLVNFHGSYHPTGMDRTWPNQITREGLTANEIHRYGWELTPELMAGLPLTRYLIGPGDYYPGGFQNVLPKDFFPPNLRPLGRRGHTPEIGTRAHALSLCVAYDSPLLTLADIPECYRGACGVDVLKNLPAAWKETRVLEGDINSCYAVARRSYDDVWYVAAVTARSRHFGCGLDFLGGGEWAASIYRDDIAGNDKDACALKTESRTVRATGRLEADLADVGGCVAVIRRSTAATPVSPVAFTGSDTERLKKAVAAALANGVREVVVPRKPDGRPWLVDQTIVLPDDFTLELDNSTLAQVPGREFDLVVNEGALSAAGSAGTNVVVRGLGGAELRGRVGFRAVNGFVVENLTMGEAASRGIVLRQGCANGRVSGIRFAGNGGEKADGVIVCDGARDLRVENVTGVVSGNAVQLVSDAAGCGEVDHVDVCGVRTVSRRAEPAVRLAGAGAGVLHHANVSDVFDAAGRGGPRPQCAVSLEGRLHDVSVRHVVTRGHDGVQVSGELRDGSIRDVRMMENGGMAVRNTGANRLVTGKQVWSQQVSSGESSACGP